METIQKLFASIFEELGFQIEDLQEKRDTLFLTLNKGLEEDVNEDIVKYLRKKLGQPLNSLFVVCEDCIQVICANEDRLLLEDLKKLESLT